MPHTACAFGLILVCISWGTCVPPVLADVVFIPESIQISAQRGSQSERYFLIQSDTPIIDLKPIVLDLPRQDGKTILSADAIKLELEKHQIQANEPAKAKFKLNLTNAPCGQFQGSLLLKYKGGDRRIPVTITVRAPVTWPLVWLVAGVALGTGLSTYRVKGLSRDETLVKVSELRTQIRSDRECPEPFILAIQNFLNRTETQLLAQDQAAASSALKEAQARWQRWQEGQQDWLALLDYHYSLTQSAAEEIGEEVFYGKAIASQLRDVLRQVADFTSPSILEQQLQAIAQRIEQFPAGLAKLDILGKLYGPPLPQELTKLESLKAQDLTRRLHNLIPGADEFKAWSDAVDGVIQELAETVKQHTSAAAATELQTRATVQPESLRLTPIPSRTKTGSPFTAERLAPWRIRLFSVTSHTVAIIFLAWAGLHELYLKDAKFGSEPLSDYFSLLAWGFGAEVTRESVTKVIQNLGVISGR
jgi:hypothetical protein